jgi:hypothetical protein
MRSLFSFTTAVLPTIAALIVAAVLVKSVQAGARQMAKLLRRPAPMKGPRGAAPGPRPAMRRAIAPGAHSGGE